jgi:cytochrome b
MTPCLTRLQFPGSPHIMHTRHIRVWDLPTRLCHWLLVALVLAAFVTGQLGGGLLQWHGRFGLAMLGLLSFRVVWGFLGSTYARFPHFFPWPGRVLAYLRGQWHGVGHNPLGALSVLALLGLLALQTVTGLFASDDIAFQGPLQALVSADTSAWLTRIHRLNINLLIALMSLHVTAILFYTLVKKDNLVKPMFTGLKEVEESQAQPAQGGGFLPFLIALSLALAVVAIASGIFIPLPPPLPPAPAW